LLDEKREIGKQRGERSVRSEKHDDIQGQIIEEKECDRFCG
jgi:hypothetical protein